MAHFAHDLKTPINHIIGYCDLLLEEAEDSRLNGYLPGLQRIHAAGRELLAFVNENLAGDREEGQGPSQTELHRGLSPTLASILHYGELLQEDARGLGNTELLLDLQKICTAARRVLEVADNCPPLDSLESGISDTRSVATTAGETPEALSSAQSFRASGVQCQAGGGSVLVVDDNELSQQLLVRHLERQGHNVSAAENGQRALEMIKDGSFDLVLLDVMMPVVDGYQVLEYLKDHESLRDIPVIMLSALDDMESAIKCIQLGAVDYLPKPFNPALMRARISACLERRRLELAQRQQLQEQMLRVQRMENADRLTSVVAHNFNSMLSVIIDRAEMRMRKLDSSSETWEDLEQILQAAQASVALFRQLMVFSRGDEAEPRSLNFYELPGRL